VAAPGVLPVTASVGASFLLSRYAPPPLRNRNAITNEVIGDGNRSSD
jgi:hypothetical protein